MLFTLITFPILTKTLNKMSKTKKVMVGIQTTSFSVIKNSSIEKATTEYAEVAGIPMNIFARIEIRGNNWKSSKFFYLNNRKIKKTIY